MADEAAGVDLGRLSRRFTLGADEFISSPLYRRLSLAIGADEELLTIAAACRAGQQPTNLFLAAVHFLLLGGVGDELAAYYPSVTMPARDPEGVEPVFQSFCRAYRAELIDLVRRRLVQTNVVRRSAALRLGLSVIAGRQPGPVTLLEIGCSAGIHLRFDRYRYEIAGRVWGNPESPVRIDSEWRGAEPPPDLDRLPRIVNRLGIDLNPMDARDPTERRWLRSLIWPENRSQAELQDRALAVVAEDPPEVIAGDALDVCPRLARDLPAGQPLVVFHAATRYHVPRPQRPLFDSTIAALGRDRPLYWLSLEGPLRPEPRIPAGVPLHVLALRQIEGERRTEEHLALEAGHADWIEPLDL